jgi:hypothetical protein
MPLTPPDSPIAMRFAAGLGYRQGILHERSANVVSIVIHTTGSGILARFIREGARHGDATPFETAARVYTTIMGASGHYVVGQLGECVQVVPERLSAWHVGAAGSQPYVLPQSRWMTVGLEWWGERWPELRSPQDLAGGLLWRGGSCNDGAVGIEVVPPIEGAKHPWSPECWRTLARLVLDIAERHSVPVDREYLVTHSDAHPLARSARGAPWDVCVEQWSYDRLRSAIASGA